MIQGGTVEEGNGGMKYRMQLNDITLRLPSSKEALLKTGTGDALVAPFKIQVLYTTASYIRLERAILRRDFLTDVRIPPSRLRARSFRTVFFSGVFLAGSTGCTSC